MSPRRARTRNKRTNVDPGAAENNVSQPNRRPSELTLGTIATIISTLTLAAQIYFSVVAQHQTRDGLELTQSSLKASQDAVALSRSTMDAQFRPWISLYDPKIWVLFLPVEFGSTPHLCDAIALFTYRYQNVGSSPALRAQVGSNLDGGEPVMPSEGSSFVALHGPDLTIFPGLPQDGFTIISNLSCWYVAQALETERRFSFFVGITYYGPQSDLSKPAPYQSIQEWTWNPEGEPQIHPVQFFR